MKKCLKKSRILRWLFLTLSIRNAIGGDTLEQNLTHLTESFRRLFKYKKISKNLIGFMHSTEVTVNKNDGSYNQHMHVLLCVENAYFRKKILHKQNWLIYGNKH